jgi:hypothetical protein
MCPSGSCWAASCAATQLGETLLPKRIALPVFASDALSSVAYAPGRGLHHAVARRRVGVRLVVEDRHRVALVMLAVVASYRQNVHAYPSGGGDYEVATVNLGRTPASPSPARCSSTTSSPSRCRSPRARSTPPRRSRALVGHEATVRAVLVVVLMAMNLRGVRESGARSRSRRTCSWSRSSACAAYGLFRWPRRPAAGRERR